MIIKNRDALATTESRKQVLDIIEAGISKVLPTNIMKSAVRYDAVNRAITINSDEHRISAGRIFVVGGGKASGLMAEALENIIPPGDIVAGVVNCKGGNYETQNCICKEECPAAGSIGVDCSAAVGDVIGGVGDPPTLS